MTNIMVLKVAKFGEDRLNRFWRYLVKAFRGAFPQVEIGLSSQLRPYGRYGQSVPIILKFILCNRYIVAIFQL